MLPRLIQGGMGLGVSGWPLAREVSSLGQLGVVSGSALDTILVRRLGCGDPGGHMRRAMAAFPRPDIAHRMLERFFRPDGTQSPAAKQRFKLLPLPGAKLTPERQWLLMLANFVEVYLAKEGHHGVVGINFLHKIQFPMLPSLYGAMMAGVDVVLMGAGIPGDIPAILDRLSQNLDVTFALEALNAGDVKQHLTFEPMTLWGQDAPCRPLKLHRPKFLAIVSSATLARALLKKAPGGIYGFVVESPIAGGHNAPPRGPQRLSVRGEPIYGERDELDMKQMVELGMPFWLAGGFATREKFIQAQSAGARGIQVGTAFAFCQESGLDPEVRERFLTGVAQGGGDVFTDPDASPTSFPFKVAALKNTMSEQPVYADRPRLCDLGYLRRAYTKPDGSLGYRCPGEPVEDYIRKGGTLADTVGRKCLCNGLMANVGLGQRRPGGYEEPPLLTAGDDLACLKRYLGSDRVSYHARDVVEYLVPPA